MRQRSSYGWLELIIGILLSALGIYSFFRPVDYLTTLIVVYGVAAFVTGIADIVFYCKMERHIGFAPTVSLVTGVLGVMAGLVLMVHPCRALGNRAVLPALVHRALHLQAHAPVGRPLHRGYRVLCDRTDRQHPRHPARHFDAPDAAGDVPVDEPRHRLLSAAARHRLHHRSMQQARRAIIRRKWSKTKRPAVCSCSTRQGAFCLLFSYFPGISAVN